MSRVPYVVLLTGRDGPHMIAGICDALESMGCRLADTHITRLAGRFTGMIVIEAPPDRTAASLSEGFDLIRLKGCRVEVARIDRDTPVLRHRPDTRPFVVSYSGGSHPGMLQALAHALDDLGCEFVSVSVDVVVGDREDAYVLVCEVDAPLSASQADLAAECHKVSTRFGIPDVTVLPANMDEVAAG